MTPHMCDFIRAIVWDGNIKGSVLEIGSYIEANQDHLDFRRVFPRGTPYVGVDANPGKGVDRVASLFDASAMNAVYEEVKPLVIVCLYVLEHVWDIHGAAKILADLWRRNTESWLFVATHQNQPFHGTDMYPDYWRLTGPGLLKLFQEAAGIETNVFSYPERKNPEDVLAIRQPLSNPWTDEKIGDSVRAVVGHWERHS